jgi:ammonia channel protein AmtB
MNPADTAWMLIATALVLLMTRRRWRSSTAAGPLEERAEHDDDEFHLAGFVGVLWAVVGYRWR